MYRYYDNDNNFAEWFNPANGFYLRTGVLNANGNDTGIDPFMRNFPALIDVGIMGSCVHGSSGLCAKSGVQCYQNGMKTKRPNMSFDQFKRIVEECKGKCQQYALGGRGDVDQHENFADILKYCRENNIVPNFTSSGLGFTPEIVSLCKKYCGAVAISWYRQKHTIDAINMLINAGVKTNIHYVLGNNSIDEAIDRLKNNDFPAGINAIVFLTHKPIGQGAKSNVLKADDPRVKEFFELVDKGNYDFKIGFDSCACPGIVNFCRNINMDSIDHCEAARFSCYIDSDMNMMPCSFDNQDMKWAMSLNDRTIKEVWDSDKFEDFRKSMRYSCVGCKDRAMCAGGCPIVRDIVLCNREEKELV